jgi:spore coat polysaccharide biosynthesis protein SpsF
LDGSSTGAKDIAGGSVVIAVGDEPESDAIIEWCRRESHNHLTGPEDDLLARHRLVLERTGADTLVSITGDCPVCPPAEAIRLIDKCQTTDAGDITDLAETMPIGTAVDVIDGDLPNELAAAGETHPVQAIRESPEEHAMRISPNPDLRCVAEAHIAVDTPSDYWRLADAMDEAGPEPQDIIG